MTDTTELRTINGAGHKPANGTAEDLRGCAIIAEREGDIDAATRLRNAAALVDTFRKQIQQEQHKTECLRISRDEWKRKAEAFEAQAKGKITDEWRRRVAAGEEGEVE